MSKEKFNYKKIIIITSVLTFLLTTVFLWSSFTYRYYIGNVVDYAVVNFNPPDSREFNFTDTVMKKINMKWTETYGDGVEFLGYLDIADGTITNINFAGEKNLITREITVYDTSLYNITEYTIHSHPNGICIQSDEDKFSMEMTSEKVQCIVCGVNKIRCFGELP